ncbi:MAG: hypothetical protein GY748_08310 [Planctomycetaceae bacterium]|nr:hypothetical protein [Planctomycetaceae bacterium]
MNTIISNPWLRPFAISLLAFSFLLISGCSGCLDSEKTIAQKKAEEKKKKPKDPFETNTPVLLPGQFPIPLDKLKEQRKQEKKEQEDPLAQMLSNMNESGTRFNRIKSGHWYTTNFQAVANNSNFGGDLEASGLGPRNKPASIPGTNYFLTTSRPASLPKGELKNLETSVYIPIRNGATTATVNFSLKRPSSGITPVTQNQPIKLMGGFQYHIVVLSSRPDSFSFINRSDSIRLSGQQQDGSNLEPFYYVVPSVNGYPSPLPKHSLNWTTIAYLIWDDLDPNEMAQEHQEALLDWLHFGGQLILSGPDCLAKLQTSFLADYLPATFDSTKNITNADISELNQNWSLPPKANKGNPRNLVISNKSPLLGVTLTPHPDANFITGAGKIAIERRVGRGRIAITSFSLNDQLIRSWGSFSSFLNGALLRMPARRFAQNDASTVVFNWIDYGSTFYDPLIRSTLRYLSRDLSATGTQSVPYSTLDEFSTTKSDIPGPTFEIRPMDTTNELAIRKSDEPLYFGGYQDTEYSGVAGWSDYGAISSAARETLKQTAGISPPSSGFVLKMLAIYLFILVPLNWLFFRMIRKVEYAWIAVPIIALVAAFTVVKLASLDIGFARSNTQISLLEVHADYPRAHMAEYSALYTSLSTRYTAELDNRSAQSLPFSISDLKNQKFQPAETQNEVTLRRTVEDELKGFQIQSNSTGLLHTEAMVNLGGVISFSNNPETEQPTLSNSTLMTIENAAVIGRDKNGKLQFAPFDSIGTGEEVTLKFQPCETVDSIWQPDSDFTSLLATAESIWETNLNEINQADIDTISKFPEIKKIKGTIRRLLVAKGGSSVGSDEIKYTKDDFMTEYAKINSTGSSKLTLDLMRQTILRNLAIDNNEYRLIGISKSHPGNTVFSPAATQTVKRSLVVAHLQRGELPIAKRDLNSVNDFKITSNLDQVD